MFALGRLLRSAGATAFIAVLAIGVAALLDGGGAAQAQQAAAVTIADNTFTPKSITVAAGTTVTWTDAGQNPHTVTSDTGVFDSGRDASQYLRNGATFRFTFTQAGTFPYYCVLHGSAGGGGMSGTIVVTAQQAATSPSSPAGPAGGAAAPAPARTGGAGLLASGGSSGGAWAATLGGLVLVGMVSANVYRRMSRRGSR